MSVDPILSELSAAHPAQSQAAVMKEPFHYIGYPTAKVSSPHTDRESLLAKKNRATATSSRITFSAEYSPLAGRVKSIILKHWKVLKSPQDNTNTLPPSVTFKHPHNLRDRLVVYSCQKEPNIVSQLSNQPTGFFLRGRCAQCSNLSASLHIPVLLKNP